MRAVRRAIFHFDHYFVILRFGGDNLSAGGRKRCCIEGNRYITISNDEIHIVCIAATSDRKNVCFSSFDGNHIFDRFPRFEKPHPSSGNLPAVLLT